MSSAVASPARTCPTPALGQGSKGRARVFGQSTPVSLASFDRDTWSWRTSQLSLLGGSEPFSQTWPRSGMTRSGTAFQLQPLAPLTAVTGSGLLHTPTAKANQASPSMRDRDAGSWFRESWPTPRVSMANGPSAAEIAAGDPNCRLETAVVVREMWPTPHGICQPGPRRPGPSGNELGRAVNQAERQTWATPTAWLGRRPSHSIGDPDRWIDPARSNELSDQVAATGARTTGGALNPTWVEWLMNFPLGWTEVE
jgi:hypothetical protein